MSGDTPASFGENNAAETSGERHPQEAVQQRSGPAQSEVVLAAGYMRHHSGPLPDPSTLAEYERILPGAAERTMARFEKQSDHRMAMETKVIQSNTFSQNWSTVMSVFFGTLSSFLGTFVVGRKVQASERQAKAAQQERMRLNLAERASLPASPIE